MERGHDTIRVLVAGRQPLFCEALKLALEREAHFEVAVAGANRARGDACVGRGADVAVLDPAPAECGAAITSLRRRSATCRIVFLADEGDKKTLIDLLQAGATGVVTKNQTVSELAAAVRAVHAGEVFVPQHMLGALVADLVQRRKERDEALVRATRLTPRERAVLVQLAQGFDTNAIAEAFVISPQTARTHIQNVLCKLGVHSRLEAAALVMNNDILDELTETDQVSGRTHEEV